MFWNILGEINRELIFLDPKVSISERRTEILTNFFFFNMFENGKILRKIWNILNNFFWTNQWKGTNKKTTGFLPKVSHIQLNYVFRLFWSILGEIHIELSFLVKKVTLSERCTEKQRKYVFLNMFEKVKYKCFWSNKLLGNKF